jgi:hypothetical protein
LNAITLLLLLSACPLRARADSIKFFQYITLDQVTYSQWTPQYDLFQTAPYAGLWTQPTFNLDRA